MKKLTLFSLAIALSSCCMILNGHHDEVNVTSNVPQSTVMVNGQFKGQTPCKFEVKRTEDHTVTVTKEGYSTYKAQIGPAPSGWLLGNLIFGGLPGLIIDFCSGAWAEADPDNVEATLVPTKVTSTRKRRRR